MNVEHVERWIVNFDIILRKYGYVETIQTLCHTPSVGNAATPVAVRWQMTVHHPSSIIHHWSLIVEQIGVSPGSVAIVYAKHGRTREKLKVA